MEEVLRTILANLVENQKAVSIDHVEREGTDFYYVKVAQEEEGTIIPLHRGGKSWCGKDCSRSRNGNAHGGNRRSQR